MNITIDPKKQTRFFLICTALFVVLHYLSVLSEVFFGNDIALFDLGKEGNLPTMFATMLLLYSSALSYFIWQTKDQRSKEVGITPSETDPAKTRGSACSPAHGNPDSRGDLFCWMLLSVIFLFLAIDEFASIHETIGNMLERFFDKDGPLWFPWKIPFGLGLIFFVLSYLKFLARLPGRYRNLFVISGAIYVTGAIGIELAEGLYRYLYKISNFNYRAFEPLEESLELLGVIFFIETQLAYAIKELRALKICVLFPGSSTTS